jgi:hypothetical protein
MVKETTAASSIERCVGLIHQALRTEATRAEELVSRLEPGGSLQPFRNAFDSWASALLYVSEREDKVFSRSLVGHGHQRAPSPASNGDAPEGREEQIRLVMASANEQEHMELTRKMEAVLEVLNDEIRDQQVITRTKQHLYRQVMTLRIAQEDHLETEAAMMLPALRAQMDEREQLKVARGLLIDEEAQDPRWIIDWVSQQLNGTERESLKELEARFDEP